MHAEGLLNPGLLIGFLLVFSHIAAAFVYAPLPGLKSGTDAAKIVLSGAVALSVFSQWPSVPELQQSMLRLAGAVLAELVFGLAAGLLIAFVVEAFQMGAQIASLQAGFSFATTIDPTSQADSGILSVAAQLFAGLLFFSMGLHREVIRAFALSLAAHPPGSAFPSSAGAGILHMGSGIFSTGLRLAFPLIALLLLADIALALVGRLNSQLQLLTLALPIKILLALGLLFTLTGVYTTVFRSSTDQMARALRSLVQQT